MKTRILFIIATFMLSSCSFFRVIPYNADQHEAIVNFYEDGRYMVLQRGQDAWHATDIKLTADSLHMKLDIYLGYHVKYLNPREHKLNTFRKKEEPEVINSVHIFTSDTSFSAFDKQIAIPRSKIVAVKKYEYARGASIASIIFPIVGVGVLTITIIAGIAARNTLGAIYGI